MTYLRGIAIGLGIYALCWGLFYAGVALSESDYLDTFLFVFWALYCIFIGVAISRCIESRA